MFIDRETELKFMEEKYAENKPQVIILYGRRRVGKTELIKEFIKTKNAIYFLAEKGRMETNFDTFCQRIAENTGNPGISFKGWVEAFEYLKRQNKKVIIALDEFPYLIKSDPDITSTFQRVTDEVLPNSSIYLIICGSSVSIMEDKVLAYRSPLYGRRTGQWQLNPLQFKDARLFFPKYSTEQQIQSYAIGGGIPLYLSQMDERLSINENLTKKFLFRGSILYEEPKFVLNQEFSDANAYFTILESLANGKNTVKEISDSTKIDSRNLNKYLKALMRLHYVAKIYPTFYEKNKKSVRYFIKDNFFDFWFKFVNPNFSDLEVGNIQKVQDKISWQLNAFVGKKFESVAEEILLSSNRAKKLPFDFENIAPFWDNTREGKAVEIDRVAINSKEKKLLVVECKWKLGVSPKGLLSATQEKVKSLPIFEGYNVFYAFFAKSFKHDSKDPNVLLFDLKDMEKLA